MTHMGNHAHVILPGVSFAEKDGTFTSMEGRVQRVRKAISPVGSSRPDWEILCDLSSRMGYPHELPESRSGDGGDLLHRAFLRGRDLFSPGTGRDPEA